MKTIVVFVVSILLSGNVSADTLKPFITDGCSYFPDGRFEAKTAWRSCCQQHDFDYWQGGTYQQRLDSDKALKVCVANAGEPVIAMLMLVGVRVGGTPWLPSSFRWGYGWSYPRSYGELSKSERQQVKKLTELLNNSSAITDHKF